MVMTSDVSSASVNIQSKSAQKFSEKDCISYKKNFTKSSVVAEIKTEDHIKKEILEDDLGVNSACVIFLFFI